MSESIFSAAYWKAAANERKHTKKLVIMALLCALAVAVSSLFVTVGENLYVYFTCYVNALACAIGGPILGMLYGAAADTLSFFLFPVGAYFPGYLLSEILGDCIYALFLYRKTITPTRIFGAKCIVNYGVNVLLGSVWSSVLMGKGYLYYLWKSLIKNTILLPFEVLLMGILFAALIPFLSQAGILPAQTQKSLGILKSTRVVWILFGADFLICSAASFYNRYGLSAGNVFTGIGIATAVVGCLFLCIGICKQQKAVETDG